MKALQALDLSIQTDVAGLLIVQELKYVEQSESVVGAVERFAQVLLEHFVLEVDE